MRNLLVVLLLIGTVLAEPALAEPALETKGEVIEIHDPLHPPVPAQSHRSAFKIPRYSDAAIESDVWTRAWFLLDVSETGQVLRAKFLKHPGHDLDAIALDLVLGLTFEPARDATGNRIRSQLLWPIEWPSYYWLMAIGGNMYRIDPDHARHVPCAGSGPLNLDSKHAVYRDCSQPDLSRAAKEPWLTAPPPKH